MVIRDSRPIGTFFSYQIHQLRPIDVYAISHVFYNRWYIFILDVCMVACLSFGCWARNQG